MNNLIHVSVDTTEITDGSAVRSVIEKYNGYETTAGVFWLYANISPAALKNELIKAVGTATLLIFRTSTDLMRDAVLDAETRAWFARVVPGVQIAA